MHVRTRLCVIICIIRWEACEILLGNFPTDPTRLTIILMGLLLIGLFTISRATE